MSVKFFDYSREYGAIRTEVLEAVDKVFASGQLILGPQGEALELEFAQYTGAKYAVGVNSGTDALSLALLCLDIKPGDEVITVANTATATIAAIRATGAVPKFVDVDPRTLLMDLHLVPAAITAKTRAIIPVHLYGNPVNIDELMTLAHKHGLKIIEDCAHAHGSFSRNRHLGTIGDIGCFSFYPTKTIGAYGDAGMCVTNSKAHYEKLKLLRMYGFHGRAVAEVEGRNSRLDEVHAAILRLKLNSVATMLGRRKEIVRTYASKIKNSCIQLMPTEQPDTDLTHHLFVVRTAYREQLMKHLDAHQIGHGTHYRFAIHLMPAYQFLNCKKGSLPITEKSCDEVLSLPLYPNLSQDEIMAVINAVNSFVPSRT